MTSKDFNTVWAIIEPKLNRLYWKGVLVGAMSGFLLGWALGLLVGLNDQ